MYICNYTIIYEEWKQYCDTSLMRLTCVTSCVFCHLHNDAQGSCILCIWCLGRENRLHVICTLKTIKKRSRWPILCISRCWSLITEYTKPHPLPPSQWAMAPEENHDSYTSQTLYWQSMLWLYQSSSKCLKWVWHESNESCFERVSRLMFLLKQDLSQN